MADGANLPQSPKTLKRHILGTYVVSCFPRKGPPSLVSVLESEGKARFRGSRVANIIVLVNGVMHDSRLDADLGTLK